jgi:hypothetical protein
MNFRVEYIPTALGELANVWTPADSQLRQAITRAAHAIDLRLARDPYAEGESRPDNQYVLFELPLGVTYEIDEEHHVVWVLHVWHIRRKSK